MTKECFKCKKTKSIDLFYKHSQMSDGHVGKCKECNKVDVRRNYRKRKKHYSKYERSRNATESRQKNLRYRALVARSTGRGTHRYSVEGKEYLSEEEFDRWWEENRDKYLELHQKWLDSGRVKGMSPSIDRIDNNVGYLPHNMQWMTHGENSKKHTKIYEKIRSINS